MTEKCLCIDSPQNKCVKRVWIQRCKTVMRTFQWNANKLLCSEHFVGFKGPTDNHPLPSMFPTESGDTKTFPTTSLESTDGNNNSDVSDDIGLNDAFLTMESDDDENYQPGPHFNMPDSETILDVSAYLHDYCGLPVMAPKKTKTRAAYVQAESDVRYGSTQTETDPVKRYTNSSTQTTTHTCEVGIQCSLPLLTYYDVKDNDEQLCFYTGIHSNEHFQAVFDEIKDNAEEQTSRRKLRYTTNQGGRPRSLSVINKFFMVLMRLRLGLLIEDLAFRFCLSKSQCSDIVNRWIDYLSVQLAVLVQWPSMEIIKANMPKLFKEKFPDTRIIVDCTEIYTEVPSSLQLKSLMYSDYKSHMTYKALVGISPNGVVTFVSDLWCGSISDKQITKECGLLELLTAGDAIMVDKGFTISDLTTPKAVKLIIPPFKKANKQFSKKDVLLTKDIAMCRIHVERQMERIKNFRILQGNIPISMAPRVSKVFKICTYLTNLQPPLVQD